LPLLLIAIGYCVGKDILQTALISAFFSQNRVRIEEYPFEPTRGLLLGLIRLIVKVSDYSDTKI